MGRIIVIRHEDTKDLSLGSWQGCILDMERPYPDNFIFGIWSFTREEVLEACLGRAVMIDSRIK